MNDLSGLLKSIHDKFVELTRERIFLNYKEGDDFYSHVQKVVKLNRKDDWDIILASEDLIEDTNEAIAHFLQFGLTGLTKLDFIGEKYLRLYGILNAIYLQQSAVLNMYKLFNCPNPNSIKLEFDNLEITQLRHKLGAHSVNYLEKSSSNMEVFIPIRIQFGKDDISYSNYKSNEVKEVALSMLIDEYMKVTCKTYLLIIKKFIKTIFKGNAQKQDDMWNTRFLDFEYVLQDKGSIIQTGDKKIFIRYV